MGDRHSKPDQPGQAYEPTEASGGGVAQPHIQTGSETPPHRLAWLAAQIGPEAEEVYMSTADMLRAEGRAEGIAKGVGKGVAHVLVRQLTRRFGAVPDEARQRIDTAPLEQLEAWTDRVLDAETLDEVFEGP